MGIRSGPIRYLSVDSNDKVMFMPAITDYDDASIFFHPIQNTLLISTDREDFFQITEALVGRIMRNKALYEILDDNLGVDVFVRHGDQLIYYPFNREGAFEQASATKTLKDNGHFGFGFSCTDSLPDLAGFVLTGNCRPFSIHCHTDDDEMSQAVLEELASFIKENANEQARDWNFDNIGNEELYEFVKNLIAASTNFYYIRDDDGQIVGTSGLDVTKDRRLAYCDLLLVKKGLPHAEMIIVAILHKITNDYPEASMTAYVIDDRMRRFLGEESIIQAGENKIPEKTDKLKPFLDVITFVDLQQTLHL